MSGAIWFPLFLLINIRKNWGNCVNCATNNEFLYTVPKSARHHTLHKEKVMEKIKGKIESLYSTSYTDVTIDNSTIKAHGLKGKLTVLPYIYMCHPLAWGKLIFS